MRQRSKESSRAPLRLRALQTAFAAELTATHRRTTELPASLAREINDEGLGALDRFNRYKGFHRFRLVGFLRGVYEAVFTLLPKAVAWQLEHDFLVTNRSTSYSMLDYVTKFARFLRTSKVSREYPFLPDLGRLEWLMAQLFSEPTRPPRVIAGAGCAVNTQFLTLRSEWDLVRLWRGRSTLKPKPSTAHRFRLERAATVCLVKLDLGVRLVPVTPAVLRALKQRRPNVAALVLLNEHGLLVKS